MINEYLSSIIVLTIAVFFVKRIEAFDSGFQLLKSQVIGTVIVFSLLFEAILPFVSSKFTSDVFDVFCYGFGGLFYLSITKPVKKLII